MSQARFSVRTAVAEGFDFWRAQGLRVIGSLSIGAVAALVANVAPLKVAVAASAINFIALLMAQGALFRIALAPVGAESADRNGPLGIQWRGLESRLLGMTLLLVVLLLIIAVVATFVLAVVLLGFVGSDVAANATSPEALMASISPTARFVFNFGLTLCLLGILVLVLRLTMAAPATAAEGGIRLLNTLGLTKGSVIRILAAVLVVNLPIFALQGLALGFRQITHSPETDHWAEGVAAAMSTFFYIPISVGMTSYIYRRLKQGAGQ